MIVTISIDIEYIFVFLLIVTSFLLFLYAFFDVNTILTHFCIWLCCEMREKISVNDIAEYYSICLTTDVNICYHMNNARYLRELNHARFYCLKRNGLLDYILKSKGTLLQTASYIRYTRAIPLFTLYKITTKVIYWDEKHLYLEHYFITLRNGTITAVILSKSTSIGVNLTEAMCKLLKTTDKPEIPADFQDWIELNKKSSVKLSAQ